MVKKEFLDLLYAKKMEYEMEMESLNINYRDDDKAKHACRVRLALIDILLRKYLEVHNETCNSK